MNCLSRTDATIKSLRELNAELTPVVFPKHIIIFNSSKNIHELTNTKIRPNLYLNFYRRERCFVDLLRMCINVLYWNLGDTRLIAGARSIWTSL